MAGWQGPMISAPEDQGKSISRWTRACSTQVRPCLKKQNETRQTNKKPTCKGRGEGYAKKPLGGNKLSLVHEAGSTLLKNSSPKTHSSLKVAAPLHPHNSFVVSKQTNLFYPQKPFLSNSPLMPSLTLTDTLRDLIWKGQKKRFSIETYTEGKWGEVVWHTWINLEELMLNGISQTYNDSYLSFTSTKYSDSYTEDRVTVSARGWARGGHVLIRGLNTSVKEAQVLEMDRDGGHPTV